MTNPFDNVRRRSPDWVRALDSRELHGLGGALMAKYRAEGLSDREDWLLDAVLSELAYRRRRALRSDRPWWQGHERPCSCELCFEPFPARED